MGDLESQSDSASSRDDNTAKQTKRTALPLANLMPKETSLESGFHRGSRICLERIREALLHHRWQEAAECMISYPQIIEESSHDPPANHQQYKQKVWRMATEILHHHPNSKMEDYSSIYELMKHSSVKDYLMISQEHAFHLLLHGHIMDAKRQLSVVESWRYGKVSADQEPGRKLTQAYRSLLDYIIWCDKKRFLSNAGFHVSNGSKEMENCFRQASVNLNEILKHPGVWDPFILSYVEMQEFYDNHEDALKVLTDYVYDSSFPPNPNAHVYLYKYLKRTNASDEKLMKLLKRLHTIVPSHELMLDYCHLLMQSEEKGDLQKALGVILEMLDFACWRRNLDAWKCLRAIIDELQSHQHWEEVVSKEMAERKEWWPVLHLTGFHAHKDLDEEPELMKVKASLAKILCPDLKLKYLTVLQDGMEVERAQKSIQESSLLEHRCFKEYSWNPVSGSKCTTGSKINTFQKR